MKLRYKKKNLKRVQRLLALQPTPMKGPPKRAERSLSLEVASPPAVTKKRPLLADSSASGDGGAASFKHPRNMADKSIAAARPSATPTTPLPKATPMVRVTSNNSQVLTPSETASYTPRSNERPPTGQGDGSGTGSGSGPLATGGLSVSDCRHRYDVYLKTGTKLKHGRDAIVKNRLANGTGKADGTPGSTSAGAGAGAAAPNLLPSERKLVAALSLEMVMSYMIAFKSLNQGRYLERKGGDVTVWERLMPHLAELRSHARHFRPMEGLALQLRAICFEQMLAAFMGHDAQQVATRLQKATKARMDAWVDAAGAVDAVGEEAMKVVVGPWLGVEDTVRVMLPVLRRWCDKENVAWEQELQLPS